MVASFILNEGGGFVLDEAGNNLLTEASDPVSTFQYMAPYPVIYLQYLGPPGAFTPFPGETVTSFTGASNLVVPIPPTDGRWWNGTGTFQPRFLKERDIPRSGWSIHDELCHHCLKRHRHVCQE